ncbi:MAG: hypothetical protein E5Y55_28420 [Mesorhizobium sp.]|nr:MAG: hypothetical protein E5Y55_28420 [Mesorhizobium sp.]
MDPHPNPPHKGEGTLPRALTFPLERQAICRGQRQQKSPSPLWGGLGVGVHRRAKASAIRGEVPGRAMRGSANLG